MQMVTAFCFQCPNVKTQKYKYIHLLTKRLTSESGNTSLCDAMFLHGSLNKKTVVDTAAKNTNIAVAIGNWSKSHAVPVKQHKRGPLGTVIDNIFV